MIICLLYGFINAINVYIINQKMEAQFMNNLINAIQLYNDERIKKLEIALQLAEDKREKQAIKLSILNLQDKK